MPRIHIGQGNRRSGPASSRSRRSSSSFASAGRETYDRGDSPEFDQFDYNEFEEAVTGNGAVPRGKECSDRSEGHCDDNGATQVSKFHHDVSSSSLPRQAMLDLSDSSEEDLRPKRKLGLKRKDGVGKVVLRSAKPAVTSPGLSTNYGEKTGNNQLAGAPGIKKLVSAGKNSRNRKKSSCKKHDGNVDIDLTKENEVNTNCGTHEADNERKKREKEAKVTEKQISRQPCAERGNVSKSDRLPYEGIRVLPLRGLAIDNRAIPTEAGHTAIRYSLLKYIPQLIEGGLERGLFSPSNGAILASLTIGAKCPKGRARHSGKGRDESLIRTAVVPRASFLFEGDESPSSWLCDFLEPVDIGLASPDDNANIDDIDAFTGNNFDYGAGGTNIISDSLEVVVGGGDTNYRGPKGFSARESWGYFGELVEEIERKLSASSIADSGRADVTIFTSDSNLFADVRSSSHADGIEMFWRSINKNPHISAVNVIVVDTTRIMQMMDMKSSCSGKSLSSTNTAEDKGEVTESNFFHSASLLPNRFLIQCINDIRQRICNLNQCHLESSDAMPVNIQLEFIECNAISFFILLQAWVRQSFGQTFSSLGAGLPHGVGNGVRGRLRFDLPETLDGTTCSISLDLQYTVLPHCVSSPAAAGLAEDMRCVSSLHPSSIEVVQSVPLSSIDSSLIFGTPMRACAGCETDVSRYNEMKMLARQLWRYLGRNDVGLVIRARTGSDRTCDKGMYSSGEQMFLLVSEESVQQAPAMDQDSNLDPLEALRLERDELGRGEAPCHGMLYRYALKNQILHFGNEDRMECEAEEEVNSEVGEQYFDYIERSLDTLVKTGLNPLLMGASIING